MSKSASACRAATSLRQAEGRNSSAKAKATYEDEAPLKISCGNSPCVFTFNRIYVSKKKRDETSIEMITMIEYTNYNIELISKRVGRLSEY